MCAKLGVQSSNTSRVLFTVISRTPVHSRFCHIYCVSNGIEVRWLWSKEFNTKKLLIIIFSIHNLFNCVAESWWNMPFKGTRHGYCVADSAAAKLLRLWQHASALWHHMVWIRIVTSHNAWIGYEYSLPNLNHHNLHPLETMGHVW